MTQPNGCDGKIVPINLTKEAAFPMQLLNMNSEMVLLVTDDQGPSARTMKYAANLCRHTSSSLIIVNMPADDQASDEFKTHLSEFSKHLKDIQWSQTRLKGPVMEILKGLAGSTNRIISIILDKEWLNRHMSGKRHGKWLNKLGCPVVVVDRKGETET